MGSNMRLLSLAAVIAIAGCAVKEAPNETAADSAATPAATTAAPNEVTITATEYSFDAPAEIPAGLTSFRMVDNGKELHHAQLMKLEHGRTFDDLIAVMKTIKPAT